MHKVCNWPNVSTIDATWAPEQVTWLWACSAAVCFTLFLFNYFLEAQLYSKLGFFLRPWQPCQVFLLPLYVDYTLLLKCSSWASKVQFWGQNSSFAFLSSRMNLFCHTLAFSIIQGDKQSPRMSEQVCPFISWGLPILVVIFIPINSKSANKWAVISFGVKSPTKMMTMKNTN